MSWNMSDNKEKKDKGGVCMFSRLSQSMVLLNIYFVLQYHPGGFPRRYEIEWPTIDLYPSYALLSDYYIYLCSYLIDYFAVTNEITIFKILKFYVKLMVVMPDFYCTGTQCYDGNSGQWLQLLKNCNSRRKLEFLVKMWIFFILTSAWQNF